MTSESMKTTIGPLILLQALCTSSTLSMPDVSLLHPNPTRSMHIVVDYRIDPRIIDPATGRALLTCHSSLHIAGASNDGPPRTQIVEVEDDTLAIQALDWGVANSDIHIGTNLGGDRIRMNTICWRDDITQCRYGRPTPWEGNARRRLDGRFFRGIWTSNFAGQLPTSCNRTLFAIICSKVYRYLQTSTGCNQLVQQLLRAMKIVAQIEFDALVLRNRESVVLKQVIPARGTNLKLRVASVTD